MRLNLDRTVYMKFRNYHLYLFHRSVWSLTILSLTINRYRIIKGQAEFSVYKTRLLLTVIWVLSIFMGYVCYLISPGAPWHYMLKTPTAIGIFLQNALCVFSSFPVPIVLLLLILTAYRARNYLDIISSEGMTTYSSFSQQLNADLRLLEAFGIIYVVGFGISFIDNINQIINLSGMWEIVPYWQGSAVFCAYSLCFQELCNIIMNFSNSVIVARTRHVRVTLRKMYQSTCSVVEKFTRSGDRTREPLIGEGSTSTSRVC